MASAGDVKTVPGINIQALERAWKDWATKGENETYCKARNTSLGELLVVLKQRQELKSARFSKDQQEGGVRLDVDGDRICIHPECDEKGLYFLIGLSSDLDMTYGDSIKIVRSIDEVVQHIIHLSTVKKH